MTVNFASPCLLRRSSRIIFQLPGKHSELLQIN
jgi:hypothetical protein